jgi:glycine cleavage system H lipoate-binding protein
LSSKTSEAIKAVALQVGRVEAAQVASKEASTQAIAEMALKNAESLKQIGEEIKKVEAAQIESAKSATDSLAKLTQEVGQTNKTIKELQETLKSTVTL